MDLEIPVLDDVTRHPHVDRASLLLATLESHGITMASKTIADLGAGYGSLAVAAASRQAAEVVAVDVHAERLASIRRRAERAGLDVETRRMNLLDEWAQPMHADVTFLIGVVEYAGLWDADREPADLQRDVFRTAYRALRPGGTLVFGSKNRLWPRFAIRDVHTGQPLVNVLPRGLADRMSVRRYGNPYRHHVHSPRGWAGLLRDVGFVDVETFIPLLSYQYPLAIAALPSRQDVAQARRKAAASASLRQVAWGRLGSLKAYLSVAAATAGLHVGHSVLMLARRPLRDAGS